MVRTKHQRWSEENIVKFGSLFTVLSLAMLAAMFDLDTEKSVSGMASYFRSLGYEIGFRS